MDKDKIKNLLEKHKKKTMFSKMKNKLVNWWTSSKRQRMIYIIILIWISYFLIGLKYEVSITGLAAYVGTLITFVSNWLIAESKRASTKNGFCNSKRELITYLCILLWYITGLFGMEKEIELADLSAYFLTLSGFVGTFVWTDTLNESKDG